MNCAGCHAYDLTGGMGPDLTDGSWQYGAKPGEVYHTIAEGTPRGMPALERQDDGGRDLAGGCLHPKQEAIARQRCAKSEWRWRCCADWSGAYRQSHRPMERPTLSAGGLTDDGPVLGLRENGVTKFLGIPYAKPPVGALRWMPPQPVAKWTAVRRADKFGPTCAQVTTLGPFRRSAQQQ